jgi:NADH-quinone oxidoreductase subunit H
VCALAECNRTPFDLPEAENELNFGYHQEYSSMKLGFYLFAEYINMFISGVVMATLFFGGYDIPFVNEASWGNHWWVDKSVCFYFPVHVDTMDHSAFPF